MTFINPTIGSTRLKVYVSGFQETTAESCASGIDRLQDRPGLDLNESGNGSEDDRNGPVL